MCIQLRQRCRLRIIWDTHVGGQSTYQRHGLQTKKMHFRRGMMLGFLAT